MKPLTAATITDEQIRELLTSEMSDPNSDSVSREEMCLLEWRALSPSQADAAPYRARCAEILNARAKESR